LTWGSELLLQLPVVVLKFEDNLLVKLVRGVLGVDVMLNGFKFVIGIGFEFESGINLLRFVGFKFETSSG
jgi:hypothetical protein